MLWMSLDRIDSREVCRQASHRANTSIAHSSRSRTTTKCQQARERNQLVSSRVTTKSAAEVAWPTMRVEISTTERDIYP